MTPGRTPGVGVLSSGLGVQQGVLASALPLSLPLRLLDSALTVHLPFQAKDHILLSNKEVLGPGRASGCVLQDLLICIPRQSHSLEKQNKRVQVVLFEAEAPERFPFALD